jgi:hypothetical protein
MTQNTEQSCGVIHGITREWKVEEEWPGWDGTGRKMGKRQDENEDGDTAEASME